MLRKAAKVLVALVLGGIVFAGCENNSSIINPSSNGGENAAVRLSALGDCENPQYTTLTGSLGNDELIATVEHGKVSFIHSGALFNCCMDSVSLEMETRGNVIRVVETEHTGQPCFCVCEYMIYGEILDLEPGTYTLEICPSMDSEEIFCSVEVLIN
jgi:hypothetical protein